jgi:protoporphyrin/coproporphyrin ferrochelatase
VIAAGRRVGVLLMAFGTPPSEAQVPAFLQSVLGRPPTDVHIADLRSRYRQVGGSPLLAITTRQAAALETELLGSQFGEVVPVAVGMRHSSPSIADGMAALRDRGATFVVALPLAPQWSPDRAGYVAAVQEAARDADGSLDVVVAPAWHLEKRLICALSSRCLTLMAEINPGARVLFTAHSLPKQLPGITTYRQQLEQTALAVATKSGLNFEHCQVVLQSAPPGRESAWMGPHLLETIAGLPRSSRDVAVVPIQFLADHLEVLYDIDIAAHRAAEQRGLRLHRITSLNEDPLLIGALADVVHGALPAGEPDAALTSRR